MRGLVLLATVCACGRLGFEARSSTDGAITSSDDGSSGDGAVPQGWSRIAAGDETTCGIYKSRAYCWGRGTGKEIGDGQQVNRPSPTAVSLPAGTVTDIVQGEGNACAIVDSAAYCWGSAAIGNGTGASATPQPVSLPATITSIAAGGGFACAIANTSLYCWGNDPSGALGNGAAGASLTPALVTLPATPIAVDAGNDHTIALLADNTIYVWGHNDSGCFGVGSTTPTSSDAPLQTMATASVLPRLAGWHMCALKSGAITCWGMGTSGELGNGTNSDSSNPVPVTGMSSGVTAMETGGGPTNLDATCAVVGGAASCWGSGTLGRLGNRATTNATTPTPVIGLPADIVELALGFEHSCARSSDGSVRCWGRGDLGQLGDGQSTNSLTPVVVPLPP